MCCEHCRASLYLYHEESWCKQNYSKVVNTSSLFCLHIQCILLHTNKYGVMVWLLVPKTLSRKP